MTGPAGPVIISIEIAFVMRWQRKLPADVSEASGGILRYFEQAQLAFVKLTFGVFEVKRKALFAGRR